MQTIQDSISPVWEEPFRFMIHDPNYQELDIEVQIHPLIMALVKKCCKIHVIGGFSHYLIEKQLSSLNFSQQMWYNSQIIFCSPMLDEHLVSR